MDRNVSIRHTGLMSYQPLPLRLPGHIKCSKRTSCEQYHPSPYDNKPNIYNHKCPTIPSLAPVANALSSQSPTKLYTSMIVETVTPNFVHNLNFLGLSTVGFRGTQTPGLIGHFAEMSGSGMPTNTATIRPPEVGEDYEKKKGTREWEG
jgi:hypothetical protein